MQQRGLWWDSNPWPPVYEILAVCYSKHCNVHNRTDTTTTLL